MSLSKISLDEIIRFTSRTAGRDKVYRTIQYASRFLAWYYIKKQRAGDVLQLVEKFQNLESVMSLTRKGKKKKSIENFYLYLKE